MGMGHEDELDQKDQSERLETKDQVDLKEALGHKDDQVKMVFLDQKDHQDHQDLQDHQLQPSSPQSQATSRRQCLVMDTDITRAMKANHSKLTSKIPKEPSSTILSICLH